MVGKSTWNGLQILETKQVNDNKAYRLVRGTVYKTERMKTIEKKSLFEREQGQWRFVTGDELKNPTVRYETPLRDETIRVRADRVRSIRSATARKGQLASNSTGSQKQAQKAGAVAPAYCSCFLIKSGRYK